MDRRQEQRYCSGGIGKPADDRESGAGQQGVDERIAGSYSLQCRNNQSGRCQRLRQTFGSQQSDVRGLCKLSQAVLEELAMMGWEEAQSMLSKISVAT